MTGSILGCIHGVGWLGAYVRQLQDAGYLKNVAAKLFETSGKDNKSFTSLNPVNRTQLELVAKGLRSLKGERHVALPDGREGQASGPIDHQSFSKKLFQKAYAAHLSS
jgi:hypothetical protein